MMMTTMMLMRMMVVVVVVMVVVMVMVVMVMVMVMVYRPVTRLRRALLSLWSTQAAVRL